MGFENCAARHHPMIAVRANLEKAAKEWPEPVASQLLADEADRKRRDKGVVKFCPICGRKPDEWPDKAGRHIWKVRCEKCQLACIIHVCE